MNALHVSIDPDLLKRLYMDERLTATEIAARVGCAPNTILRRLQRFAIPARPRGPSHQARTLNGDIRWSPNLAYAVGLIATDGNLSRDGRHLSVTSKDHDLLETFRACLNVTAAIRPHGRGSAGRRRFYEWLLDIGLTPAKSLTLGALAIPDDVFADFVRGCIDGDGSVTVYVDRQHTHKSARYVYERLYVTLFYCKPCVPRLDSGDHPPSPFHERFSHREARERQVTSVDAALCEERVDRAPSPNLLFPVGSLSAAKARDSGTVPPATGPRSDKACGATEGGVGVRQCGSSAGTAARYA